MQLRDDETAHLAGMSRCAACGHLKVFHQSETDYNTMWCEIPACGCGGWPWRTDVPHGG